jgi:hypothetical protein
LGARMERDTHRKNGEGSRADALSHGSLYFQRTLNLEPWTF